MAATGRKRERYGHRSTRIADIWRQQRALEQCIWRKSSIREEDRFSSRSEADNRKNGKNCYLTKVFDGQRGNKDGSGPSSWWGSRLYVILPCFSDNRAPFSTENNFQWLFNYLSLGSCEANWLRLRTFWVYLWACSDCLRLGISVWLWE